MLMMRVCIRDTCCNKYLKATIIDLFQKNEYSACKTTIKVSQACYLFDIFQTFRYAIEAYAVKSLCFPAVEKRPLHS